MNKQELIQLIFSKNKNGIFSKEDILEIGLAHKSLPRAEKNWNWLADLVGWKNGDALSHFIKYHTDKNNIYLDETLNNTDILVEKKQQLYIQQQKVRDEWTAYRKMLRDDARIDSLKDAIKSTVDSLNSLPLTTNKQSPIIDMTELNEGVLLLSDLHIGVDCNNFYNKYNVEIAIKRLDKLATDVIRYCNMNNIKILNICNLGDMIHGIIHTNARIEQELDVVEQLMKAGELVAQFLNKIQDAAPKVIYRSVVDNHSRAMANKSEAIEKENFSKLIDWFLQERLKNTNIEFVNDNIDEGIGKFELTNGKKVMFAHGHNDNINQAYQHFTGATQEFIDYILLGHYHCEKAKSYQGARVIVNGSVVGTEQYALSKRLFSKPSQTLLIFNKDNLINISIDLNINE